MKSTAFLDMAPCSLGSTWQCIRTTSCCHRT